MTLRAVISDTCDTVTLSAFLDALLDKDLSGLVKAKSVLPPRKKDLEAAWLKVYGEYGELLQSDESLNYVTLLRQKIYLENRIYLTSVLVDTLLTSYNEDAVKSLRAMGYGFKFKREKLNADLLKVVAKLKAYKMELKSLERQIAPLLQTEGIERSDFMEALAILGKYQGYRLDPKSITVAEYITVLNSYKKWHQTQKSTK